MTDSSKAVNDKPAKKKSPSPVWPVFRVALLLIVLGIVYWLLPEPKPPLVVPETEVTADWRAYGADAFRRTGRPRGGVAGGRGDHRRCDGQGEAQGHQAGGERATHRRSSS